MTCDPSLSGTRLVHPILAGERHPMSYAREACAAVAGCEDRADWKNCKMDGVEAEEAAVEALKKRFAPFDPAAQA